MGEGLLLPWRCYPRLLLTLIRISSTRNLDTRYPMAPTTGRSQMGTLYTWPAIMTGNLRSFLLESRQVKSLRTLVDSVATRE